ncbi:MAG: pilus assembly protein MshP [Gammaproteobacteria bacterium]|nr:pilus assembly protein MshP [Gammaproteobacteria bacterium]
MKQDQGFSIITVVFVLVVLAGLGAVMAQLGTAQHLGMAMAQDGRQAYYAARAGLEWGRDRLVRDNVCTTSSLVIEGFAVTVQCQAGMSVTEGSQRFTSYLLTSTASLHDGVLGTVSRELQMAVWR